jgi:tRNA-Thr(GGU) m(6)t(6)A37 methyltransferase TsaA
VAKGSIPKSRPLEASYPLAPIGTLHSCFREKFGIPRQPGLVTGALGYIKLDPDFRFKNAIRKLDTFSHLWVIFVFHQQDAKHWKPSIRPPRLGGVEKVGVLASRSPHRPNPIGLSAVKLERIDWDAKGGIEIHVSGVDVLDGTPVLDIKPYIPYADSIPDASAGWADQPILRNTVVVTEQAELAIAARSSPEHYPNLRQLIIEMLEIDPRPAFQQRRLPASLPEAQGKIFGFRLFEYNVKWEINDFKFHVLDVSEYDPANKVK